MVGMLECVIFFNGLGNLTTEYTLLNSLSKVDIFIVIYGFVYVLIPWGKIVNHVFDLNEIDNDEHYLDSFHKF